MKQKKKKSRSRQKISKKTAILLASIVLIMGITIGTTVAYLLDSSNTVTNTFSPVSVTVDVEEEFENNEKTDVDVRNKSDIPVYIRAAIVEYWKDAEGNVVAKPETCSRTITYSENLNSYWILVGDVYYYKTPVDAKAETENLIDKVTVTIDEEKYPGYTYHLDVYAEAIQAEPSDAVKEAWNVTLSGTAITGGQSQGGTQ